MLSYPTILPVYFHGQNSRLFQIASHLNYHLKLSLFFYEMRRMIGREIRVSVGHPKRDLLGIFGRDENKIIGHLYQSTMALQQHDDEPFYRFAAENHAKPQLPRIHQQVA